MDAVVRIGNAYTVNMRPSTPILIRDAGRLPESEWATVDKALKATAARSAAASGPMQPPAAAKAAAGGKAAAMA